MARHQTMAGLLADGPRFFYVAVLAALWIPDADFIVRMLVGHPAARHGGATHSLAAGILFGALFALACRRRYGSAVSTRLLWVLGTLCSWAHALMDMATWGNGVMLLWPFSLERLRVVPLFFGARHSELMNWRLHLITLTTELLFIVPIWWLSRRVRSQPAGTAGASR